MTTTQNHNYDINPVSPANGLASCLDSSDPVKEMLEFPSLFLDIAISDAPNDLLFDLLQTLSAPLAPLMAKEVQGTLTHNQTQRLALLTDLAHRLNTGRVH